MSDSDSSTCGDGSQDFEERFTKLKLQWKNALKKTKKLLLKCPNYQRCQFKCGSVGGMQYHYLRCTGKSPHFKCSQCSRKYESRTGLNYHMASSHGADPVEEVKIDVPSRPQRTAALSTMSAMLIANNPPLLKQAIRKTPPKTTSTLSKSPAKTTPPEIPQQKQQKLEPKVELNLEPKLELVPVTKTNVTTEQKKSPKVVSRKGNSVGPIGKAGKGDGGGNGGGIGEEEGGEGGGGKGKKGSGGSNKFVNIPSIEYPDEYKSFLPSWRQEMKDNKIIRCPNYGECEFKCTTVNGMKYHYVRCMKANPPEFNCEVCGKKFQCRTGLVWHLKKTHMLVDIQPSKQGGFKGTISSERKGYGLSYLSHGGRRKVKLEESWRGRHHAGGRKTSVNSRKDCYSCRSRRRIRKSIFPRRTADYILQNIMNIEFPPEPQLAPESCRNSVSTSEYIIADSIPTDVDPAASAIITLGEEALQWQKMYSDSESEDDYIPDIGDVNMLEKRGLGSGFLDEGQFDGYLSASSVSDSDEEYTIPYKRRAPKPAATRGEGGRGYGRRGRGGSTVKSDPSHNKNTPSSTDDIAKIVGYIPPPSTLQPPPLSSNYEGISQTTAKPDLPTLIKASLDGDPTKKVERVPSITVGSNSVVKSLTSTHIQPPPGLIMPSTQQVDRIKGNRQLKRQPPPLVKKEENSAQQPIKSISLLPNSPSKVYHPQIVIPCSDGDTTQRSTSTANTHEQPLATVLTPAFAVSGEPTPPLTTAPVKRRPGRPRKDQVNPQAKKTARTVQLSANKPNQRSQPSRGSKNPASSPLKSIKLTQYKFQSQQPAQTQGVILSQQSQHAATSPTAQQYQPLILSPGGSGIHGNLVTPLQIIPAAPQANAPVQVQTYSTVPQGGLFYLQGATPQVQEQPTYVTKDGQLYQLIHPRTLEDVSDSSKKVSVIMQPQGGTGTTYVQGDIGSFHCVTQLDGLPPSTNQRNTERKDELRKRFQKIRRKVATQQLDGPVPKKPGKMNIRMKGCVGSTSGLSCDGGDELCDVDDTCDVNDKSVSDRSCDVDDRSCDVDDRTVGDGVSLAEQKMSDKLLSYFQKERTHRTAQRISNVAAIKPKRKEVTLLSHPPTESNQNDRTPRSDPPNNHSRSDHVTTLRNTNTNTNNNSNERGDSATTSGRGHTGNKIRLGKHAASLEEEEDEIEGREAKKVGRGNEGNTAPSGKRVCSKPTPAMKRGRGRRGRGRGRHQTTVEEVSEVGNYSGEEETCPKMSVSGYDKKQTEPALKSMDSLKLVSPVQEKTPPPTKDEHSQKKGRPRKCEYKGQMYSCNLCESAYTTKAGLTAHMSSNHHPPLAVDASLCDCSDVWKKLFKKQNAVVCHICKTHKAKGFKSMIYHWKRCGKCCDIVCPHCDKVYTTQAGLRYHINTVHRERPETPQEKTIPEQIPLFEAPDLSKPLPSRRAAAQAIQKMKEFTQEGSICKGEGSMLVSAMERGGDEVREDADGITLSKEDSAALKLQLKNTGSITCPQEECGRVFRSLPGIKYHLTHFHNSQIKMAKYLCPICKKILTGKKRLVNHYTSKHPQDQIQLQSIDDCEYHPESSVEGDDQESSPEADDWEAEIDTITPECSLSPRGWIEEESHPKASIKGLPQTYSTYRKSVKVYFSRMYESEDKLLMKEEWRPNLAHWEELDKCEQSSFLPTSRMSVHFRLDTEEAENSSSLPLFQATLTATNRGAVMFTGGPVWAMDWLPQATSPSQWLALSAYKDLDELHPIAAPAAFKSVIQLWDLGDLVDNLSSSVPLPKLSLLISHQYGCIRALKWYRTSIYGPLESVEDGMSCDKSCDNALLGVLSLACGDGCVRILSIPKPSLLEPLVPSSASLSDPPPLNVADCLSEVTVVRPVCVAAVLLPVGMGSSLEVEDCSEFGQCLCLEWFPGNKCSKIAAGFSNGAVCIWDLNSELFQSSFSSSLMTFHPVIQLAAHRQPCRCISWCPNNENYLFTGGFDRMAHMWDIRQPFSPVDRQEKGMMTHCAWPVLWCNIMTTQDSSQNYAAKGGGLNYINFTQQPHGSKSISMNKTTLSGLSYSVWTDRAAAISFAGELSVVTFPSIYHITSNQNHHRKRTFIDQSVFGCRLEPTKSQLFRGSQETVVNKEIPKKSSKVGNSPLQSMKELAKTKTLVLTLHSQVKSECVGHQYLLQPDGVPLTALTQVCWSPNEASSEWLVVGTNSGLVHLLFFPAPSKKPPSC